MDQAVKQGRGGWRVTTGCCSSAAAAGLVRARVCPFLRHARHLPCCIPVPAACPLPLPQCPAAALPPATAPPRLLTVQRAECEEGMPPESTTARMSHTPFLNRLVKNCGCAGGGGEGTEEGREAGNEGSSRRRRQGYFKLRRGRTAVQARHIYSSNRRSARPLSLTMRVRS